MWVIGNGESRKNISISKLEAPITGCNAVYRDHTNIDYLVCVDRRMVQEAIIAKANEHCLIYTREDWYDGFKHYKGVRKVPPLPYVGDQRPDQPFHWGSGPYAVLLGAIYTREREVKMLGFDLYSKDTKINNIYKDTPNYDSVDKSAVDPSYWIYQIGKVMNAFPKISFTIYQESSWVLPQAWNYPNVKVYTISNINV